MIKEELYKRSIDVLSRAYLEGHLEHGDPCGCAVGNMVAASCGFKIVQTKYEGLAWKQDGVDFPTYWWNFLAFKDDERAAISQIHQTGYTVTEVIKIEKAFESVSLCNDHDGYLGLMAVVECLGHIHEVNDEAITKESMAKFQKVCA